MATDVIMPQMGESVFEGTITKWLKKPGDKVQRDEPLFEISTDKVDAEIPAPASGVLQEIKASEGTTVQVNTVVGTIAADGEGARGHPGAGKVRSGPEQIGSPPKPRPQHQRAGASRARSAQQDEEDHARSSPLVRKIAREHNVNLSQVSGTGLGGRITKQDIMAFIEGQSARCGYLPAALPPPLARSRGKRLPHLRALSRGSRRPRAHDANAQNHCPAHGRVAPHQRPRPLHVSGGFLPHRSAAQQEQDFLRAAPRRAPDLHAVFRLVPRSSRLQQFPIVNSSLEGESIRYHRNINVGIAVALDWGLIVPVLKNAGDLNFLGLQRGIADLGERARNKKLKPDDVEGSTFTVTNPGQFGAVFGLPIINQPNAAIMGVGGITKTPLVVTDADGNDSIAIRSVVNLTLGYDHRIIDGAVADQFMAFVKKTLENWSEEIG